MVFISHDTRDERIAEELSILVRRAASDKAQVFRSSDRTGREGIDLVRPWFPFILQKIDEASVMICLLTTRSIDRPCSRLLRQGLDA